VGVPDARADEDEDVALAKILFDKAVELASAGNFDEACRKLEKSLALHDGLGTSYHLAGCWQKTGRTASAYALFEKVADKAHELGQTERETVARGRMEALLPKLSRLRIDLPSPAAPRTAVQRDGERVAEGDWGKPVAVDRGSHEIRVTADGKVPWSTKISVTEPSTIMAVQVPELADAKKSEAPKAAAAPRPKPAPQLRRAAVPAPEAPRGGPSRTVAIVSGGVGAAALAGGLLEGAQYLDANGDAKNVCPSGVNCTSDEIKTHDEAVDRARTARNWAYVGLGVGSVALAVGTYLFFTAPHEPARNERASALNVEPLIDGQGTWGGALRGRF
jgi:serine/threonine-protein kinase